MYKLGISGFDTIDLYIISLENNGDGMGSNVGPSVATIEGEVRSLQHCCPSCVRSL